MNMDVFVIGRELSFDLGEFINAVGPMLAAVGAISTVLVKLYRRAMVWAAENLRVEGSVDLSGLEDRIVQRVSTRIDEQSAYITRLADPDGSHPNVEQ